MCGIAGAVFWDRGDVSDPVGIVRTMTDTLAHRGPDGEGVWRSPAADRGPVAIFGHRRLAIIDLSDRAAQPMVDATGAVVLTFNGEIYNFQRVRKELEAEGRRFKSDSDGEVILQGYEQWGDRIVDRLRGMFAFAIWDGRAGRLLLARDRMGIKPLYIYNTGGAVLFASEMRALTASGLVPRRLDPIALDQFLAYQTVAPPRTLIAGIEMLGAGTCRVISPKGDAVRLYWDMLAPPAAEPATGLDAVQSTRDLLSEATALHLISDVPVGVFLSGGVDSTALAALVKRTGVTPHTFCVSFPGTSYDEGPRARRTAAALGAEHLEIPLTEQAFRDQLPAAFAAVDHPSADGVNTYVVSHAVRRAGVKVALSGLGGDELFGGYPSFRRLRRLARYARLWQWSPAPVRRVAAAAVRTLGGPSSGTSKAAALLESDGGVATTYPVMRELFSPARRRDLLVPAVAALGEQSGDPYVRMLSRAIEEHPQTELMSFVSYAEARTYMHDVLLRDTDQMSMRHGLEVRVPLLDHRLVEHVIGLPDACKTAGFPKQLLVDAVGDDTLTSLAREPKRGFVFPFELWMRGELREFCEHHLGPDGLEQRSFVQRDAVAAVWKSFHAGNETWSRPGALVALTAWLESTGVSA